MLLSLAWLVAGCDGQGQVSDDDAGDDDAVGDDDTAVGQAPVADVAWRLHENIESLVIVTWTQLEAAEAGFVEYQIDGQWRRGPMATLAAGEHEQLLLGIPYHHDVTLRVVNDIDGQVTTSAELVASTGPLPDGFPAPELLAADADGWEASGEFLLGSVNQSDGGWVSGQYWMWVLDRAGRVVWTTPTHDPAFTIYVRVSRDGRDILWDEATYWSHWDNGASSKIHRMKIDGTITDTVAAPGLHHAFLDLPDGSILWGDAGGDHEVLQWHHPDGDVEALWDCGPFFEGLGMVDWCHSNSMFWNEADDTLLYSFPSDSFVLELDLATATELRWWGHIPTDWSFDPEESSFYMQHGATFTDEGTLLLSSYVSPAQDTGVVREYEIDAGTETLRQLWTFGADQGIQAHFAGEAHRLPGGNTLHNYGTTPRVREITPGGDVVWDLTFGGSKLIGRTIWLDLGGLYDLAP